MFYGIIVSGNGLSPTYGDNAGRSRPMKDLVRLIKAIPKDALILIFLWLILLVAGFTHLLMGTSQGWRYLGISFVLVGGFGLYRAYTLTKVVLQIKDDIEELEREKQ